MNERIEHITKQVDEYFDDLTIEFSREAWQAKFAELIVGECMRMCDVAAIGYESHNHFKEANGCYSAKEYIEEHFGVEPQEKVAVKPKCSVCGTTENVKYMGGYQPYLCDSVDCTPF